MNSHINHLEDVDTRDDEEDPRTPGSSTQDPPKTEDDCLLVLLDHLDDQAEGEGESDHNEDDGGQD